MYSLATIPLNLQFKGQRNYIQGGDVYTAVHSLAPRLTEANDVFVSNLAFRRFAKNDCDLSLDQPEDGQEYIAKGKISDGQGKDLRHFWVLESERPAAGRYAFDEQAIVTPAAIKDQEIILQGQTGYAPIEETIALTKALHYQLMPDINGRWVFGQLDLDRPFSATRKTLRIELISAKARRFSMSKIFEDDELTGNIRFIVGDP
jgi:hypothetical protein